MYSFLMRGIGSLNVKQRRLLLSVAYSKERFMKSVSCGGTEKARVSDRKAIDFAQRVVKSYLPITFQDEKQYKTT